MYPSLEGGWWDPGLQLGASLPAGQRRVGSPPLLSADEATTGLLCPVLGSPVCESCGQAGEILIKGHRGVARLEDLSYQEAEWAGTVQPAEEKAQGNLIQVYKYLKRGCKENKNSSFQWCPVTLPMAMGTKMKHRRLCQNIRKHLFTVSVTKHWHRLPSGVVVSPSLEIFRTCLDMVIGGYAWEGGLGHIPSTGTFQP